MSQMILLESSPFDFGKVELPDQIDPFPEIDEDLGIPMTSLDTKEKARSGTPFFTEYSGMSSVPSSR